MKKPSFEQLQLFRFLMETRNLSAASELMNMPTSTASRQLHALREYFGDPLFTRIKDGLAVTPRCKEVYALCLPVLTAYEAFDRQGPEDFFNSERRVRIACADNAPYSLFPRLVDISLAKAPKLSFSFVPFNGNKFEMLRHNEADLAVSPMIAARELPPNIKSLELAENHYVLVGRTGHPLFELAAEHPGGVPDEAVLRYSFIDVKLGREKGNKTLREAVFPMWKGARVAAESIFFLPFLETLVNSDTVMVLPLKSALKMSRAGTMAVIPTASKSVVNSPKLYWHESTDKDPLMQWVRAIIKYCCTEKEF